MVADVPHNLYTSKLIGDPFIDAARPDDLFYASIFQARL